MTSAGQNEQDTCRRVCAMPGLISAWPFAIGRRSKCKPRRSATQLDFLVRAVGVLFLVLFLLIRGSVRHKFIVAILRCRRDVQTSGPERLTRSISALWIGLDREWKNMLHTLKIPCAVGKTIYPRFTNSIMLPGIPVSRLFLNICLVHWSSRRLHFTEELFNDKEKGYRKIPLHASC